MPAIFLQPVELWTDVVGEEIRVTDDPLGKAGLVGGFLHVGDFVLEGWFCPIALHVNRLDDAGAGDVGEELADRIIAPDRLVGSEDARLHRAVEPRQVAPVPDVVMGSR